MSLPFFNRKKRKHHEVAPKVKMLLRYESKLLIQACVATHPPNSPKAQTGLRVFTTARITDADFLMPFDRALKSNFLLEIILSERYKNVRIKILQNSISYSGILHLRVEFLNASQR